MILSSITDTLMKHEDVTSVLMAFTRRKPETLIELYFGKVERPFATHPKLMSISFSFQLTKVKTEGRKTPEYFAPRHTSHNVEKVDAYR